MLSGEKPWPSLAKRQRPGHSIAYTALRFLLLITVVIAVILMATSNQAKDIRFQLPGGAVVRAPVTAKFVHSPEFTRKYKGMMRPKNIQICLVLLMISGHRRGFLIIIQICLISPEDRCTSKLRLLIDQISRQQGKIVNLEEEKKNKELECNQLRALVNDLERRSLEKAIDEKQIPTAAVVIMACNRADYLERTVSSVLKYQSPVALKYPLFISQDGSDPNVRNKALSYSGITYMQHLDFDPIRTERPGEIIAYYKIARHYKWALDKLFYNHSFYRVIILEDDMEIAPDFFEYFEAAATLLDSDKSIMAISSWNDNGQKQFVHDPYMLYRSDFFPGLGWMLSREIWNELSPKWPKAYWDDWMRLKENRRGRQFIRPEICRTYNFGEHGSSLGQYFEQYLEPIRLNYVKVGWKKMDLTYLNEEKYRIYMGGLVRKANAIEGKGDLPLKAHNVGGDVRIQYRDQADFENIAGQFGVFEEWKDGVPRTAYEGIVVFRLKAGVKRVFLVGPHSLKLLQMGNR